MSDHVSNVSGGAGDVQRPIRPVPKRQRKFVVVVDDSPECKQALRFAGARASHLTGGAVVLFHCIRPAEFQHWMAVADRMREEEQERAEELMLDISERLSDYCGIKAEVVIKEGEPSQVLDEFMRETPNIFGLVLGVGTGKDPGPLVDYFTHEKAGELPCPIFLIPGAMSLEEIDAIA